MVMLSNLQLWLGLFDGTTLARGLLLGLQLCLPKKNCKEMSNFQIGTRLV